MDQDKEKTKMICHVLEAQNGMAVRKWRNNNCDKTLERTLFVLSPKLSKLRRNFDQLSDALGSNWACSLKHGGGREWKKCINLWFHHTYIVEMLINHVVARIIAHALQCSWPAVVSHMYVMSDRERD